MRNCQWMSFNFMRSPCMGFRTLKQTFLEVGALRDPGDMQGYHIKRILGGPPLGLDKGCQVAIKEHKLSY